MKNSIEERFDPPFAYYKHAISGYVVRPLNWEGIWKDGFIFVGGNTMLNCSNEEDAKMIADTFNRFFELLKENKKLEEELDAHSKGLCEAVSDKNKLQERIDNTIYLIEDILKNSQSYYGKDNVNEILQTLKGEK